MLNDSAKLLLLIPRSVLVRRIFPNSESVQVSQLSYETVVILGSGYLAIQVIDE